MFIASQILVWVVLVVLAGAVLALARQVGVLHERLAPLGALALGHGPQPGEAAPRIAARTLDDSVLNIGETLQPGTLQLLLFVAPTCPMCKTLLPTAQAFAQDEGLDLVLVGDGDTEEHRQMAERFGICLQRFVNGPEIGRAFRVGKLPYAVLISEIGIVIAQGLVNSREHLDSLIVAHETGLHSLQEYLTARKSRPSLADRRDEEPRQHV